MARVDYSSAANIHQMTTRQLRDYIYKKSREAQERIDSMDLEAAPKSLQNAASYIIGRGGKVKKSTSYMTKEEMREYAYDLRQFNSLDDSSDFAKSLAWKENKDKYESFIEKQKKDGIKYWDQFKGDPEAGFYKYQEFIRFVNSVKDTIQDYGYEQIRTYGIDAMKAKQIAKRRRDVVAVLTKVWSENQGKGLDQSKLIDKFNTSMTDFDEMTAKEQRDFLNPPKPKKKSKAKVPTVKSKTQKSHNNIKPGKPRKMKQHGTLRK